LIKAKRPRKLQQMLTSVTVVTEPG